MTSVFSNPKHRKSARLRPAHIAIACLAALIAAGDHATARSGRGELLAESIEFAPRWRGNHGDRFSSDPADHSL